MEQIGLFVPIIFMTLFWGIIGIIGPLLVPKSPNRGIWVMSLILTSVCCYVFWLMFFLAQWHPFFGPILKPDTIRIIQNNWTPK